MSVTIESGIKFKLTGVIVDGDSRYWNIDVMVPTTVTGREYKKNSWKHRDVILRAIKLASEATGRQIFEWRVSSAKTARMKPAVTSASPVDLTDWHMDQMYPSEE